MDTEPSVKDSDLPPADEGREVGEHSAVVREGSSGRQVQRAARAVGLRVRVEPKELNIVLRPETAFRTSANLGESPWHRVEPPSGTTVTLISTSEQTRIVTLSVQSEESGWQRYWTRWAYAVRKAPDIQGGAAVDVQDQLSPDETTLTLLLLPGETRVVSLNFDACLDGETRPGNYIFEVVAADTQNEEETSEEGLLRLRHPRVNLLDHLPSIYQEACSEPDSLYAVYVERTFFERFLRGFEDCLAPMQERAATLYRLFDADVAPAECLPWLATWVALVLNENWPELKRRQLIKEAVELYRWRGTRRGLARYLEIYTGVVPVINDRPFEGMRLGVPTLMGKTAVLGGVKPFTFTVTVALPMDSEVSEHFIREIIESEKPAHAAYELRLTTNAEAEDG